MVAVGHTRQRRERFALAAGAHHHDFLGREPAGIEGVEDVVVVDDEVAEFARDAGVGEHGAAGDDHLAARGDGRVADLLHSVDVAAERRGDDPLLGVLR